MDSLATRERAVAALRPSAAARIYNLFPLLFRDFTHMSEQLQRIAALGFNWVFLNPIHKSGLSGSLYSIRDHFSVDPRLTGGAERSLKEALGPFCALAKPYGLRVMLDLVINHVAIDSTLIDQHPEWIARDDSGRVVHPSATDPADTNRRTVWGDLAAIDYRREEHHEGLLAYWLRLIDAFTDSGVGGFRCDAAYQVPAAFWQRLIAEARRRHPDLIFVAETLGCGMEDVRNLAPARFDYLFNSSKWWDLKSSWAIEQYNELRKVAPSIAFPESHDTPRLATECPEIGGNDALARFYVLRYALAASFSSAVMMPVGYEYGFRRPLHVVETTPADWEETRFDISAEIARINAIKGKSPALAEEGPLRRILTDPGLLVLHRKSLDGLHHAVFVANVGGANVDGAVDLTVERGILAEAIGVMPDLIRDPVGFDESARFVIPRFGWKLLLADHADRLDQGAMPTVRSALPLEWDPSARIAIETVYPEVDGGRFPIKRIVGDTVALWVDIFRDGHDVIGARVTYRVRDDRSWRSAKLRHYDNDRWTGSFTVDALGLWQYGIEAWTDPFASLKRDISKKVQARQSIATEIEEASQLIQEAASRAPEPERGMLAELVRILDQQNEEKQLALLLSTEISAAMEEWGPRRDVTRYPRILEVVVDRREARFAAWYEMMPRSQGTTPGRSATFADCIARLPDIRAMGFDVLYLLPIHPIGRVNRKGPNNTLSAGPADPGSPYAIGSVEGGHTAIHPDLGTIDDFRALAAACRGHGMEIALDFAIQCAPDHPWVTEHPEWFKRRPDGSIKFAENPPKKYEDIVNIEFYGPQREAVWRALADIVLYWAREGVRIFRVDNPHTKPLPFWEWMIREVQAVYPDAVFLAEAFTRPKMMRRLAKAGFTMSYTYFTWRNTKAELVAYMTELAQSESREYFRPNFFTNTPDILPPILQSGNPAAFRIRFALASLMSGVYGIYNGFELCEGTAIPGTEDYLHSEKYEYKVWDWDRPTNIKTFITAINRARSNSSALQDWMNISFHDVDSDRIIFFTKRARDRSHTILAAISLDPDAAVSGQISAPLDMLGVDGEDAETQDLLNGGKVRIRRHHPIELTPERPLLLLRHDFV